MSKSQLTLGNKPIRISYEAIRNLTSPEEASRDAKTYIANIPAREILKIDTQQNLRDYIPAHPGKLRNAVHRQIGDTIMERPDMFISLNSGFTVTASGVNINDSKKVMELYGASIINGAQSQGELKKYFDSLTEEESQEVDFHVRVEICVEKDVDSITDIAIARNTSTNVQQVSIAGKRGMFDDLEKSLQKQFPDKKIRRSETDTEEEYLDPLKLLQICTVLKPTSLLGDQPKAHAKLKAYKNRASCLGDFHSAWMKKDIDGDEGQQARELYDFMVEIAPYAWHEYNLWRHHAGWEGRYLKENTKSIKRDANGVITVADGIVIPIVGAISAFVRRDDVNGWHIAKPSVFDEEELLATARQQLKYKNGNPVFMGRDIQSYEVLMQVTKTVLNVIERYQAEIA